MREARQRYTTYNSKVHRCGKEEIESNVMKCSRRTKADAQQERPFVALLQRKDELKLALHSVSDLGTFGF
jgi:hypothetical protein